MCLGDWDKHGSRKFLKICHQESTCLNPLQYYTYFHYFSNFLGSYYKCNSYDEKNEKKSIEGSRASLERYLFYYNRYANHQNSLNLEKDLYNKVKEKMDELQLLNMTWIEVQYNTKIEPNISQFRICF